MAAIGKICVAFIVLTSAVLRLGGTAIADPLDSRFMQNLEWRSLGPFRGGRATAVAGVPSRPGTFYIGSTGGVFMTTDGGANWSAISDDDFRTGSVGAIAVAPSNPNIVVVGMGESPFRGVASGHGDGIYISVDGGATFAHKGLRTVRQISTVRIHPDNADIIYVAAQGSPWAETEDRGVYKTTDGGTTWTKVLFDGASAGAVDLSIDPNNPKILFAALWDHQRKPWEIRSGGPKSGIWRSLDGGATWEKMSDGLPDLMGKIGVDISPARSGRVYALVEANEKGGVYRSDDFGKSWTHLANRRVLHARSWYYMHIYADPVDADTVYVQNSGFYRSIDAGKSFSDRLTGSHGDWHDLWIHPADNRILAVANDGGGAVSTNYGESWSSEETQPTAQFYRINADDTGPFFRLYAGQQDNSTVALRFRGPDGAIGVEDFEAVGGCESAHVAFNPKDPRYVYAGCYLGLISRFDRETGVEKDIRVYPELAFGKPAIERKYRFNWNAPILVSVHDGTTVYHAGNHVFRSSDRGESWETVSPDLTRADPETLGPGGRPITNEVSENYGTILALAEGHRSADLLWAGSDDGKLSVTTDKGITWDDVTPRGVDDGMFNSIEISPHDDQTVYVAYTRYKYNDHRPVIYRTTNGGRSWRTITDGLPEDEFVRVVREDPERKGLLFAGTEQGLYVSFNDGGDWQPLQNNLPHVPVTDIKLHRGHILISTQGRGFWSLDRYAYLRSLGEDMTESLLSLTATDGHQFTYRGGTRMGAQAENPEDGVVLDYVLGEAFDPDTDSLVVTITNSTGQTVRTIEGDDLPTGVGHNRFVFDMTEDPRPGIAGIWSTAWGSSDELDGPTLFPGEYQVSLSVKRGDDVRMSVSNIVSIHGDPRLDISDAAYAEKAEALDHIDQQFSELTRSLIAVRDIRDQVKAVLERVENESVQAAGKAVVEAADTWEESVVSPKREFFQDVLNWPDRLVSDLAFQLDLIDGMVPPLTQGAKARGADLDAAFNDAIARRDAFFTEEVAAFNTAYRDAGLDPLVIKSVTDD